MEMSWASQDAKFFFPWLFFYVYMKSLNPKKTQKAPRHRPQTPSIENPNPENPIQDINVETQAP